VLFRQRCKLQKASVQPLQLAFRHRVEVDPANPFLGVWSLQPTKENLGSTRICDRLLAQATFDLCVGRGLPCTARCAVVGGPPGSGLENTGGPPGPDALVGRPPPPDAGGGPDTGRGKGPGAVTSDHSGGVLDFIRTAIMALQHFAEQTDDDVELAKVHKCIVGLQSILADHATTKDKALGMTPALQHVRRSRQGY
jgi:hypothetical protein